MKEKFGKLRSENKRSQNGNLAFDKLKKSLKITIIVLLFGLNNTSTLFAIVVLKHDYFQLLVM
ncbi:hypothetical protein RhiirA5_501021, partial [Rhizophagus irregularis]